MRQPFAVLVPVNSAFGLMVGGGFGMLLSHPPMSVIWPVTGLEKSHLEPP